MPTPPRSQYFDKTTHWLQIAFRSGITDRSIPVVAQPKPGTSPDGASQLVTDFGMYLAGTNPTPRKWYHFGISRLSLDFTGIHAMAIMTNVDHRTVSDLPETYPHDDQRWLKIIFRQSGAILSVDGCYNSRDGYDGVGDLLTHYQVYRQDNLPKPQKTHYRFHRSEVALNFAEVDAMYLHGDYWAITRELDSSRISHSSI